MRKAEELLPERARVGRAAEHAVASFLRARGFAIVAVNLRVGRYELDVVAPFAGMTKADAIALGVQLGVPLELTLSCMNPAEGRHCGRCSKCRERREAFRRTGRADPAEYSTVPPG